MNGSKYERQLCNYLDRQGYHVVRAPSSGGGTERDLPDLFWSKAGETAVAAELKTRKDDIAYVSLDEIRPLAEFAAAFNAHARIVLRVKGEKKYYLIDPRDGHETDNSVRVEKADAYHVIEP